MNLSGHNLIRKILIKISRLSYLTMVISLICIVLTSCDRKPHYKNDGKQVTWNTWDIWAGHYNRTVDADPSTFEDLGDGYARDAQHTFLEGNIIKGADVKSFKCLEKRYAVDVCHVFHNDTIMTSADPKTFKVHDWYLTEDKNDFYWNGRAIHVADKKTFAILGDKDGRGIRWAKDKENAYCMGYPPVPIADYESFHLIGLKKDGVLCGYYAADKYRVYYQNHIVEGADPASFVEIEFALGQDKHRVYKEWKATSVKDYKQLSQIGCFFTDGKHLYTSDLEEFDGVDLNSFRRIDDSNWYVDKNHVFFRDSIIQGADPASFEIIDFDGSRTIFDKNRIYEGKNSKELQEYLRNK